ncbi:MAG: Glycosyl hydrolase, family 18 [Candidatus Daviesbacteria bacterium GW2011_GWA2_40_9]|uniref:Glycosyl hydrolase, family 18 n=1 Tax=Candidatus Daviesbacteria bacterium GW2011_GWA2_40_9 TaxID=1618424 RepID=A0A0G0X2F1_9BACT|nr:MAG: Glycosyl hydrolase, family 18 [Candidatus Daviesbacteria bacterium GW2011_GWA2_40_9]
MKDLLPVNLYLAAGLVGLATLMAAFMAALAPSPNIAASLVTMMTPLHPLTEDKSAKEVFGFAPFWTIDKLAGVDFEVLTTLAYFGIPVLGDGNLDRGDPGYTTFKSKKATDIFKRAHVFGTRVVLTLTQMNNGQILALLDNPEAQANATFQAVEEVKKRGIPSLVKKTGHQLCQSRGILLHDITALSSASDGIFMMAYDFALAGSDTAMPTSPLYGYKEGHYWYDVSTAVEDFLSLMPSSKLILGVPWYGYNYVVYQPEIKASTRPSWTWRGRPATQTYAVALENVRPDRADISDFQTGWDDLGQVGWKAYYLPDAGTWRMIFLEDPESLGLKYDFAKNKNLAGVGMWALGFEDGRTELWAVLRDKFGPKVADHSLIGKVIVSDENY